MRIVKEKNEVQELIKRLAQEIIEANKDKLSNMVLIGIRTGGAFLAERIKNIIKETVNHEIPLGILDITLYRDDWTKIAPAPIVRQTDIPFPIDDKTVILIDDVLFTGRTVRAAMDAILDYGRPKEIQLAVLIDRGKKTRELPICADYVGEVVETSLKETINVYFKEQNSEDKIAIEKRKTRDE